MLQLPDHPLANYMRELVQSHAKDMADKLQQIVTIPDPAERDTELARCVYGFLEGALGGRIPMWEWDAINSEIERYLPVDPLTNKPIMAYPLDLIPQLHSLVAALKIISVTEGQEFENLIRNAGKNAATAYSAHEPSFVPLYARGEVDDEDAAELTILRINVDTALKIINKHILPAVEKSNPLLVETYNNIQNLYLMPLIKHIDGILQRSGHPVPEDLPTLRPVSEENDLFAHFDHAA